MSGKTSHIDETLYDYVMAKLRSHSIGGSLLIWYDRAEAHLNEQSPQQIFSGCNRPFSVQA